MIVPIEDYLKYNRVVTPVQYIEAGQEKAFTMFISCKEYLEEVADITEYVEHKLFDREFASVTVKFRKDCLLVTVAIPMKDALPEYYRDTDLMLDLYPKDKIELLEFTGHYDIEGNEIYTGYVVSFVVNDKTYTGVIEWSNEYASFLIKTKDYYEEYLNEIDEILVLGNIYENKELINETTKI